MSNSLSANDLLKHERESVLRTLAYIDDLSIKEIVNFTGLSEFRAHLAIKKLLEIEVIHYRYKNNEKRFYL